MSDRKTENRKRYQTPLEKEVRKVAFTQDIDLSDATRIVFHSWAQKLRGREVRDAFEFVFGDVNEEIGS